MGTNNPPLSPEDVERFGPNPLTRFRTNLASVEERITLACARAGRDRASVRLLPVTKTVPAQILRYAFEVGISTFGENKIQEAMSKCEALHDLAIDWSIVCTEAVVAAVEIGGRQLAVACFCTGSADVAAPIQARLFPLRNLRPAAASFAHVPWSLA
ncbi:putative enzyme with a TIM-barrel fold [Mesorhizobium australicum WSM2073]|uniref:Alanine racemase domain protein n=3 Tax=Mesorhizobium TaxID=68287 RepID=E8TJQ6_MESCW|nr:alanine racemase domain protein [Mesorhizobium ciceri biovar biserrulae WSM1271]AEH90804.1 alanine racemase domain protein [Mesorhizobium opportunistum WSM2075]AGB48174.1 putative enzyme with a TIM-barrel fold [Mesorhizobium australicum WSM2073]OBP84722.1 alanine racemase [Mesorhizobium loti]